MKLSQDGVALHAEAAGVIEMGGRGVEDTGAYGDGSRHSRLLSILS